MKYYQLILIVLLTPIIACDDGIFDETSSGLIERDHLSAFGDYMDLTYNGNDQLIYFTRNKHFYGYFHTTLTYDSQSRLSIFKTTGVASYDYNIIYKNERISKIIWREQFCEASCGIRDGIWKFSYDNDGRISSMMDSIVSDVDSQLDTTTSHLDFKYDINGNLAEKIKYDELGVLQETIYFFYDNQINPYHGMHTSFRGEFEYITSPNNVIKELIVAKNYTDQYLTEFGYNNMGFPIWYIYLGENHKIEYKGRN